MAKEKKSFILYCDQMEHFEELTNEEAGELIKHIFRYVNDKNPEAPNRITQIAFNPIKQQLKRDLTTYESKKEDRSKAGILGNLKKYNVDLFDKVILEELTLEEAQNIAKHRKTSQSDKYTAKLAVNVNDNVNDNVNVNVNDIPSTIVEGEKQIFSDDDDELDRNIKLAFLEVEKNKEKKVAPKKENNLSISESLKFESPEWLDNVAMQQRHLPAIIIQKIDEFLIFLKTQEKEHTSRKEFVSHFINWISKKAQISQNTDSAKKETFIAGRQTEETLTSNFEKFRNYAK